MKKFLICSALLFSFLLTSCTDSNKTSRILENEGYTNIEMTGHRFFGCGEHDSFKTGFKAINNNKKQVTGVVCSGYFSGGNIRLD